MLEFIKRMFGGNTSGILVNPKAGRLTPKNSGSTTRRIREIDLSSLSYVPLPRSPARWEAEQHSSDHSPGPKANVYFQVCDADWQIGSITKTPPAERPDTAFRKIYATQSGLIMVDDLGKAQGLGKISAAALRYDQAGNLVVKKGLLHGVYRIGVHPLGNGIIAMSRGCIVHAYNDYLEPILAAPMTDTLEVDALIKRFQLCNDHLKNHLRCVALSRTGTRYLVTAVDEAWCRDKHGKFIWGVKLPFAEGWNQVANPSQSHGTSAEIVGALALMGLSLPVKPEDIKSRYRKLAKEWHPDLNQTDMQSADKMKELTAAAEVLTGMEPSALLQQTATTFIREKEQTAFDLGGTAVNVNFLIQGSELQAADWIYAACFAADTDSVYLASYSGRVVLVNEIGEPLRVYDIGSVPRRIIDTGSYLYLLTDTRLYVLHDDALHALIDTYGGGELIITQSGFALLEDKQLRYFLRDGQYLGSIIARDPIRRVYSAKEEMIVETRRHRAVIAGAPEW